MTRTERQQNCVKNWINNNCKGTVVAATGFGKSRVGLMCINKLRKHDNNASILIVVPTQVLKEQWEGLVYDIDNCVVEVINTTIIKKQAVDLLIIDECHIAAADVFSKVFGAVAYNFILCLTGTLERLDGKELLIKKYAPVCDEITMQEALLNNWVSPVKQYVVLLDVDLTEYKELDRKFNARFCIFGWDYSLAMKCLTDWKTRNSYAQTIGSTPKEIMAATADWMRALQKRKAFIASHPKKIEVCKKIIEKRKDKKIITFSSTIADAKQIGCDFILHSKQGKKENAEILKQFNAVKSGSIASSKALNTGVDVPGLSVGIIMDVNSSKIKAGQQLGRVCRFEPGKVAEIFTLIIKNTQEQKWFTNSNSSEVKFITEKQLDDVLDGKEIESRQRDFSSNLEYRF